MAVSTSDLDFAHVINQSRLELEAAGNPSYMVVVVDEARTVHLTPMVFATVGPAADHAKRIGRAAFSTGELVLIVSRSAVDGRASFKVLESRHLRKLHEHLEVIEETLAEIDAAI
jgi:hypothetical protein